MQFQDGLASDAAAGLAFSQSKATKFEARPAAHGTGPGGHPNRRWASDITGIRAWDGQKGRLAIMIDYADRMVLA